MSNITEPIKLQCCITFLKTSEKEEELAFIVLLSRSRNGAMARHNIHALALKFEDLVKKRLLIC